MGAKHHWWHHYSVTTVTGKLTDWWFPGWRWMSGVPWTSWICWFSSKFCCHCHVDSLNICQSFSRMQTEPWVWKRSEHLFDDDVFQGSPGLRGPKVRGLSWTWSCLWFGFFFSCSVSEMFRNLFRTGFFFRSQGDTHICVTALQTKGEHGKQGPQGQKVCVSMEFYPDISLSLKARDLNPNSVNM